MISWSASMSILKHCNVAKIIIPTGSMLIDFKIETIKYSDEDIIIELFHKDHYLRNHCHDLSSQIKSCHNKVEMPVFHIH